MTTATTSNGRPPRKSLSDQIEKLDGILDMMAEAIPAVVGDSVRQAVAEAVRQAVEASIREALANPTLLRAALDRHAPEATLAQPPAQPGVAPRRTLKDLLRSARDRAGSTMSKAAAKVTGAISNLWARSLRSLRDGYAGLRRAGRLASSLCKTLPGTALAICGGLRRSPRIAAVAVVVGVAFAVAAYHCGPAVASAISGAASAALAAAGMALLPLWRLISGGEDS